MTAELGQTPSLESLIAQAANNGWEFFNGPYGRPDARGDVSQEQSDRIAAIAAALYTTPAFKELLAFLAELTLHRVIFLTPHLGVDPMQNYCQGVFREGQNALLFMIFKMIAAGRDQTLKGRDI
jgi:hypothetical protein